MPKETVIKVVEVFETTVVVPAHIPKMQRMAYAYREVKVLSEKPVRIIQKQTEDLKKIWRLV